MGALAGKRALVTGGSRGIGAAVARRLAAEGASVALFYENSAEAANAVVGDITARGGRAVAGQMSAGDPASIRRAVDAAADALGGLDIVVNNAGIFRSGPVDEITQDDIDATLDVNVRGVILTTLAALPHIPNGGRIITIGSNLAGHVPNPGVSLYSASKAALIGWTQGLARDLGPREITVNIVHPGSTDTDMNPAEGSYADTQRRHMAIPRYGKPADVAALVAFVAGPEAGSINGTGLVVDGGTNA